MLFAFNFPHYPSILSQLLICFRTSLFSSRSGRMLQTSWNNAFNSQPGSLSSSRPEKGYGGDLERVSGSKFPGVGRIIFLSRSFSKTPSHLACWLCQPRSSSKSPPIQTQQQQCRAFSGKNFLRPRVRSLFPSSVPPSSHSDFIYSTELYIVRAKLSTAQ